MPRSWLTIAKINTFHVSLFSDFLQRMKETPDGDGTLLDHSLYLYGSGMGNPSLTITRTCRSWLPAAPRRA